MSSPGKGVMGRENIRNQRCGNERDEYCPGEETAEEYRKSLGGKGAE